MTESGTPVQADDGTQFGRSTDEAHPSGAPEATDPTISGDDSRVRKLDTAPRMSTRATQSLNI